MIQRKFLLVTQIFISGMMALAMTFFFSALHLGFSLLMLKGWFSSFIIAWPVAFCFSIVISPIAFKITEKVFNVKLKS